MKETARDLPVVSNSPRPVSLLALDPGIPIPHKDIVFVVSQEERTAGSNSPLSLVKKKWMDSVSCIKHVFVLLFSCMNDDVRKKPLLHAYCPFQKRLFPVRILSRDMKRRTARVMGSDGQTVTIPLSYFVLPPSV